MANERDSEDLLEHLLFKKNNYRKDKNCLIEKQESKNTIVDNSLSKASKQGTGYKGRPEFIVSFKDAARRDYLLLVETKSLVNKHLSKIGDNPIEYAVDGVIWYGKFFKNKFNTFLIAFSGVTETDHKISVFYQDKITETVLELKDVNGDSIGLQSIDDYIDFVEKNKNPNPTNTLVSFSKKLHKVLYKEGGLSNIEKPLLVAGILIALKNSNFKKNYKEWSINKLSHFLHESIGTEIEFSDIQED